MKALCKKSFEGYFTKGHYYNTIIDDNAYMITNNIGKVWAFYDEEDDGNVNRSYFLLCEYFYTNKELRKFKLKEIESIK